VWKNNGCAATLQAAVSPGRCYCSRGAGLE
jgi:hypothetical protein